MRFLIVEYPESTPFADFTRATPGSSIDIIAEPPTGPSDDLTYPCIVLVRGLSPKILDGLLHSLAETYGEPQTLHREARSQRWLGRMRIRVEAFRDTASMEILQFQQRLGAPWAHIEAGTVHLRVRLRNPDQGEALAALVQEEFKGRDMAAQIEVRELGPKDYGVWEELVQHAIGLT